MQISQKPRIFDVDLIGMILIITVATVTWMFGIKPLQEKYANIQAEMVKYTQDTSSSKEELSQLQLVVQQQEQLAKSLSETRDVLLDNTGIDQVVRNIGSYCKKYRLNLKEIEPHNEKVEQQYRTTYLKCMINGTFLNFQKLLREIQTGMEYIRVESIQVSLIASDDTENVGEKKLCDIELELVIFSPSQLQSL